MLTRSARRGTWFYCQKLRVTVKMLVMMDSWTTTSLSLVCVLEKKTSLLHHWCFPVCLMDSNGTTWEYICSLICRHRITMLIFTFSLGNDGRGRGSRSLIQIKNMYIYILSIDKTVKVKYLILFIIRASSGHWSFARKILHFFLFRKQLINILFDFAGFGCCDVCFSFAERSQRYTSSLYGKFIKYGILT